MFFFRKTGTVIDSVMAELADIQGIATSMTISMNNAVRHGFPAYYRQQSIC
jgi:methionine aminopeptidase